MKKSVCLAVAVACLGVSAATRTWSGAGDGTTWADAANWGGTAPAAGDTAAFNTTVTFAGDVVLPGNLTVSVASGMTVTLNGVVSGTGNLTKTGAGNLRLVNAANTYDGSTTVSAGSLYYTSLAKIGEASSLGRPTSAANAAITLAGANLYMIDQSNKAYETDRPVSMDSSSYFYVGTLTSTGGQSASSTITLTGPFAGMPRIRGRGTLAIRSHLGSAITGDITRTDAGTTELLNPTNSSTRNVLISDGVVRVADLGKPGPLAAGSSIYMGQNNYSTTGTLAYNGTTNAVCDRQLHIYAFTNSTMWTANAHGGRLRNETAGTCITFTGTVVQHLSQPTKYTRATPFLYIDGAGDGVLASDLGGRLSLTKNGAGTWTYAGRDAGLGMVRVYSGRFNLDGTITDDADNELSWKVQVSNAGSTLGGTGVVQSAACIQNGAILAAGTTNRCGTLTFGPGLLTLQDGAKLLFKVGAETNDRVVVGGSFAQGTSVSVTIQPFGIETIPDGTYTLMTWSGMPSGAFTLTDGAGAQAGMRLSADATGLRLHVSTAARALTWKGDGAANAWDFTAENWLAGGAPTAFADGDAVTFDDTGSADPAVAFGADVAPIDVTVNATSNYTFSGAYGLAGGTTLTKKGTGVLTLANKNAHTGLTFVEEGALVVSGSLDGSSVVTAYGACFTNTATGTIGGDAALYLHYGNHRLQGNNTFAGDVTFDTRGDTSAPNCFLYLNGSNALGRAENLTFFSHSGSLDKNGIIYLEGSTVIRGVTLVYGTGAGNRAYLKKPNNNLTVGWYGDIVDADASGSKMWGLVQSDGGTGLFILGDPSGTNEVRTTGSFWIRGGGTVHCYSRINRPGLQLHRDDAGTAILFNTNNAFGYMSIGQGTYRVGAAGAMPTNAYVTVGKTGTTASTARFDLNGFDVTLTGLGETEINATSGPNKRYVSSTAPATLTLNGETDRAWGSFHSRIDGALTLVKAGSHNFTLNGTNTYTGATFMQAGTLTLNSAKALGGTTNVVLTGGTIAANASGALNANGTLTVPNPAQGTLSLADGTEQTVDWLFVNGHPMPSGRYTKAGAGTDARLAFLARSTGGGTLFVRKGSGSTIVIR